MCERHRDSIPSLTSQVSIGSVETQQSSTSSASISESNACSGEILKAPASLVRATAEETSLTNDHQTVRHDATRLNLNSEGTSPPKQIATHDLNMLQKYGAYKMKNMKHSSKYSFEARLETFEHWPVSLQQKPEDLAEAGFFYTNTGDQTICYHCGGGLKNWEDDDDPWEQHALWFPKCNYLLMKKGQAFVDEVKSRLGSQQSPSAGGGKNSEATLSTQFSAMNLSEPSGTEGRSKKSSSASKETVSTSQETVSASNGTVSASNRVVSASKDTVSDSKETVSVSNRTVSASNRTVFSSNGTSSSLKAASSKAQVGWCSSSSEGLSTERMCKICYKNEMQIMFLPCGHIIACADCASVLRVCAVCMKKIEATVRAFLS